MPRLESWPLIRMGVPSRRSEPNASASAVPQSSGAAPSAIFARRASCWTILGLMWNPAGTVAMARPIRASTSRETPVSSSTTSPSPAGDGDGDACAFERCAACFGSRERRLVLGELAGLELADLFLGQDAVAHEPPRVQRSHAGVRLDRSVHDGLRVRGLVALVVAVPAEADQVDDDVLVEFPGDTSSAISRAPRYAPPPGSSALTWKIGTWLIFATSVE